MSSSFDQQWLAIEFSEGQGMVIYTQPSISCEDEK
jgi:hypothetical protein